MLEVLPVGDDALVRAASAIAEGAVVAIPTDTVYGLAVSPSVAGATDALFAAKRRPPDVPLPVLVGDQADADLLGDMTHARPLVDRYWPGPLTVVVRASDPALARSLGGSGETVGIRCPAHDFVRALCRVTGPLAVTSANLHREPTPATAGGVASVFGDGAVALVVDGGVCEGAPSTVVDCSRRAEYAVLREGVLPAEEIIRRLGPSGAA